MIKNNLNRIKPSYLNDYVPLMKPKNTTEVENITKTITGFKIQIKAQDLVNLHKSQKKQPEAKWKRIRGNWEFV